MNRKRAYLIVGASGAIGSAVAAQLAQGNVQLGLHYVRNEPAAESLAGRLAGTGAACTTLQSDLGDEASCRALVSRFGTEAGVLTGLALCAGTVPWKSWRELGRDDWQRALFEHCIAPFTIAAAVVNQMTAGGRIVFLSSIAPKYGGSDRTLHYASAKAALESAMRGLAREVARLNISVNGVRAGFVDTPQQRSGRSPEAIAERIARIPLGRSGTPDEVASAIVYLLSEQAAFITGELLTVAGGD